MEEAVNKQVMKITEFKDGILKRVLDKYNIPLMDVSNRVVINEQRSNPLRGVEEKTWDIIVDGRYETSIRETIEYYGPKADFRVEEVRKDLLKPFTGDDKTTNQ